mmetsp:Transcript_39110/g.92657  ORF Transcript_39110/g.92657 Transcript_39110/m.92657 type:complete len:309 (+) Transcript_39110:2875-3801(+)
MCPKPIICCLYIWHSKDRHHVCHRGVVRNEPCINKLKFDAHFEAVSAISVVDERRDAVPAAEEGDPELALGVPDWLNHVFRNLIRVSEGLCRSHNDISQQAPLIIYIRDLKDGAITIPITVVKPARPVPEEEAHQLVPGSAHHCLIIHRVGVLRIPRSTGHSVRGVILQPARLAAQLYRICIRMLVTPHFAAAVLCWVPCVVAKNTLVQRTCTDAGICKGNKSHSVGSLATWKLDLIPPVISLRNGFVKASDTSCTAHDALASHGFPVVVLVDAPGLVEKGTPCVVSSESKFHIKLDSELVAYSYIDR